MRRSVLSCITGLVLLCPGIEAQEPTAHEVIVFKGIPVVRVTSDSESTKREELTASQQREFQLLITKRNGEYIWASRSGGPEGFQTTSLAHFQGGIFHFFVAPTSGFIKILDANLLGELRDPNTPEYLYYEVLTVGLSTITYWGWGEALDL
ncbi:MAG: hypothetical protein ACE5JQ_01945 [Candidatus Methylomirabilales bacterium]